MTTEKTSFDFIEDRGFFEKLLCDNNNTIETCGSLFDFRSANIKRREFNLLRKGLRANLLQTYGATCFLNYQDICDIKSGIVVDHLIPLSTNQLNKALRKLKSAKGKKVVAQKFWVKPHRQLSCCLQ